MASGLTLVFGVMRVINVAQGALVILSAYLSYVLFKDLHVDPFLSVLIVAPFMFALGVAVQMVFIRSLRSEQAEELSLLITWALALGIEGTLGVLYPFNPGSHYDLISRLLSIVVLGGLGSVGGAVAAALLLGVVQAIVAVEISPVWSSFSYFVVLIAILLVRPQGLFGVRERTL